ncbi:MAG: hypothetical protein ACRC37_00550 [Lentisphaeria bacterium]
MNRRTYYHALKAKKSKNDGISEIEKQVITQESEDFSYQSWKRVR